MTVCAFSFWGYTFSFCLTKVRFFFWRAGDFTYIIVVILFFLSEKQKPNQRRSERQKNIPNGFLNVFCNTTFRHENHALKYICSAPNIIRMLLKHISILLVYVSHRYLYIDIRDKVNGISHFKQYK